MKKINNQNNQNNQKVKNFINKDENKNTIANKFSQIEVVTSEGKRYFQRDEGINYNFFYETKATTLKINEPVHQDDLCCFDLNKNVKEFDVQEIIPCTKGYRVYFPLTLEKLHLHNIKDSNSLLLLGNRALKTIKIDNGNIRKKSLDDLSWYDSCLKELILSNCTVTEVIELPKNLETLVVDSIAEDGGLDFSKCCNLKSLTINQPVPKGSLIDLDLHENIEYTSFIIKK